MIFCNYTSLTFWHFLIYHMRYKCIQRLEFVLIWNHWILIYIADLDLFGTWAELLYGSNIFSRLIWSISINLANISETELDIILTFLVGIVTVKVKQRLLMFLQILKRSVLWSAGYAQIASTRKSDYEEGINNRNSYHHFLLSML